MIFSNFRLNVRVVFSVFMPFHVLFILEDLAVRFYCKLERLRTAKIFSATKLTYGWLTCTLQAIFPCRYSGFLLF